MNLSINFSILLFLVTSFCNAQGVNYKITYKEIIGEDIVYDIRKGIIYDSITVPKSTQNGFLIGNTKRATYHSDFLLISTKKGKLPDGATYVDTRHNLGVCIFKDFITKKQIFETLGNPEFDDPDIVVFRDLNYYKWTLKNETRKIGKFNCKKAVGINQLNEKATCWYTDELGIIGAPKCFDGIPGLAIQVKSEYKNTLFELIKIEYPKTIKFKKRSKDFEIVSEQKYRNPPTIISEEIIQMH
ncbi:GLPGLI family protein [Tenacibaculum salmonis]|uniref:GLPGLI family protein n=1 Tax=Tenacibaculum sp. P3-BQ1 TaxID=3232310 RepID=UPI0034DF0227